MRIAKCEKRIARSLIPHRLSRIAHLFQSFFEAPYFCVDDGAEFFRIKGAVFGAVVVKGFDFRSRDGGDEA